MANIKLDRLGLYLYALASCAAKNRYSSFPGRTEVDKRYKEIFKEAPTNSSRYYNLLTEKTNIPLSDGSIAASYYLFQRRHQRRFDFDATVTFGSTAVVLIAMAHIWREQKLTRGDLVNRIEAIPPCRTEVAIGSDESEGENCMELLIKGRYIRVEERGPMEGGVFLEPRVRLEDEYLHLLVRDYVVSQLKDAGREVPEKLGDVAYLSAPVDEVRTALSEYLTSIGVTT